MMSYSEKDLKLSSYDFDLPTDLIAKRPASKRENSRLLIYDQKTDQITHDCFYNIDKYLPKDSLLVVNKSRVFKCRLLGNKSSGGKCEVFLLSLFKDTKGHYPCLIKSSGKKKAGDTFYFEDNLKVILEEVMGDGTFQVSCSCPDIEIWLNRYGKIPIPPYIRSGESDERDNTDYQTIYSSEEGSIAAPTAGLHFSENVFSKLALKNIKRTEITLHVGLGTFAPVKEEVLKNHKMHVEPFKVDKVCLDNLKESSFRTAVGTTSLRALESFDLFGGVSNIEINKLYDTDIFLHPGIEIKSVDALITNFHLPKSTLLMLVSSLIGREKVMELYKEAIKEKYRFFSYGDAMLILRDRK